MSEEDRKSKIVRGRQMAVILQLRKKGKKYNTGRYEAVNRRPGLKVIKSQKTKCGK